jgi:hypothetical protein
MVLLHFVEHHSGRGHSLLQDQPPPLMVLKNKSNRKCKLTYNLQHKHFTVYNIVTLLIAKHSGDEKKVSAANKSTC